MNRLERFIQIFQLPPAMVPYVDLVATPPEIDLIIALGSEALILDEIAEALNLGREEAQLLVNGAIARDMVDRQTADGRTTYTAGNFYATMDIWTSYETGTWRRLPQTAREATAEWQMQEWLKLWASQLEIIRRDPDQYVRIKNRDVMLLDEALDLVGASEQVCLLVCPCETTMQPGSPVIEGSMRLGERARITLERGQGRGMTGREAQAHLLHLDRMGLVHTGPRAWRENDPKLEWISHGNCNPAYAFPWRAGIRAGLEKQFPAVHYSAEVNWDQCTHCGVCTGRCPFGAFYQDGTTVSIHGATVRQVQYDAEQCYGCGHCATSCPEAAITMKPL
jgi:ferredoxin